MLSWEEAFARLQEYETLEPNWNSYGADPIASIAIDNARVVLMAMESLRVSNPPAVAPLASGGVQVEWSEDGHYLELEFAADGSIELFED